jgi:hypothetical protein
MCQNTPSKDWGPVFFRVLVGIVLIGVAVTAGRKVQHRNRFKYKSGPIGLFTSYNGIWRAASGGDELLHLVIFPPMNTYSLFGAAGYGNTPLARGISSLPEGLFVDGTLVATDDNQRVYVWTSENTMRNVSLTSSELSELRPDSISRLSNSVVWNQKIRPIVEEEGDRWKASMQPVPRSEIR